MKITDPKSMTSGTAMLEQVINKFEEQFLKQDKDQEYYHLVIFGEYSRSICNIVQETYTNIGWNNVRCMTSSENGERPGLTSLRLYR